MLGRASLLFALPGGVLAVLAVGLVATVVVVAGGLSSSVASNFRYQCDSAVGADPARVAVPREPTRVRSGAVRPGAVADPAVVPTANPFAEMPGAPDSDSLSDWQRACVGAMRSAPFQQAPLQTANTGFAVACARELALAELASSSRSGGQTGAGAFARSVILRASESAMTGSCARTTERPSVSAQSAPIACRQPAVGVATVLPSTVAAQAVCGQRVELSALSPGDLVFWDYENYAPTRVGIAVGATQLVTVDPISGEVVRQTAPDDIDVRVKRVLVRGMN